MIKKNRIQKKTTGWLTAFVIMIGLAASCSPAKKSAEKSALSGTVTEQKKGKNLCSQTVRYYIEKTVVTTESENEKDDNKAVILTLNPTDRKMTMKLVETQQEESGELTLKSCTLTDGMQSGEAIYEVVDSDVQENGNTVVQTVKIKLEVVKGAVTLWVYADGKQGGMKMTVAQWEVVN